MTPEDKLAESIRREDTSVSFVLFLNWLTCFLSVIALLAIAIFITNLLTGTNP
jgi:hypothetical protein